jgi:uncharacterized delta-60 repeat protein
MDGTRDTAFIEMNNGPYFNSLQGGDYHVYPDGRVLLTGTHSLDDIARGFVGYYNLIWFTNTGYLDTTRTHRQGNGSVFKIKELPDGKFLCAGPGTVFEGQPAFHLFRIFPDGALDPSFTTPLLTQGGYRYTNAIAPLPDGRTLLGGFYRVEGRSDTIGLVRVMPDGALDPTFEPVPLSYVEGASVWDFPILTDILPLPDGRLIITGKFDRVHHQPRGGIAMLNSDGSLSDDFFIGAACGPHISPLSQYPRRSINSIIPAPDGSYYICGSYSGFNDGTTNYPDQAFVSRLYGLDVGIAEHTALPPLAIYPNPSNGSFAMDLELNKPALLQLLDASGRTVLEQQLPRGLFTHTINANGLAPGVYAVQVQEAAGKVRYAKVMLE